MDKKRKINYKKKEIKKLEKTEEKKEVKPPEIKKEVKKVEKEIEQDFFEGPSRNISISAETGAPVLERIIQREAVPAQISTEQEPERNEKRIDYSPASNSNYGFANSEKNEDKKYETNFVPPVLSRRDMPFNATRQEFLSPQAETWSNRINESQLGEIEFVDGGRKLPFEDEQKKYKRFKLR